MKTVLVSLMVGALAWSAGPSVMQEEITYPCPTWRFARADCGRAQAEAMHRLTQRMERDGERFKFEVLELKRQAAERQRRQGQPFNFCPIDLD